MLNQFLTLRGQESAEKTFEKAWFCRHFLTLQELQQIATIPPVFDRQVGCLPANKTEARPPSL